MLDLVNINNGNTNQIADWMKAFAPVIVGVVAAITPYLTEKGRMRKQISVQREIDDLTEFHKEMTELFFLVKGHYNYVVSDDSIDITYSKIKNLNDREQVNYLYELKDNKLNMIANQRLQFQKLYKSISIYLSEKETKVIEKFGEDITTLAYIWIPEYLTIEFENKIKEIQLEKQIENKYKVGRKNIENLEKSYDEVSLIIKNKKEKG